jgi:hypothetical protein
MTAGLNYDHKGVILFVYDLASYSMDNTPSAAQPLILDASRVHPIAQIIQILSLQRMFFMLLKQASE